MYDWMHCKHLGSDQYAFGAVMFLLTFHILRDTAEENVLAIWKMIKKYYNDHKTPVQYQHLDKVSFFLKRGETIPKLRGKAAQILHLGKPLHHVWLCCSNPSLHVHRQIGLFLKANIHLETILAEHRMEYRLPDSAATSFKQCTFAMLQIQQALAHHFALQGLKLFNMTTKCHFLCHIAILAKHINPSKTYCYRGEEFMHISRGLAESCVKGLDAASVSQKMCEHYRVGLHFEYSSKE